MLTLKEIPDVAIDVPIDVPGDDGTATQSTITVRYKLRKVSETKAMFAAPEDERPDDDTLMQRDIVDIQNVKDADGNALEFSPELLAQLMDLPYVRPALIRGWMDVQSNRAAHAEKN